ncbi:ABC transporter substrate-binding protein [Clostridium grantii]|uniref:ABC-type glycerol-3-phosphate transport system, substrate-binding protein n=1 Tax=Clostridium grantii DSM 8605 TaxID=1121316 RepID=A0A1M5T2V9_9CLOT|nr:ABC transporter substrate-binding protein [Clostridium grantii]SHH45028.1 ABC-type glycerol-3-phosphate transport system, substrate-binding protein [Clostridium grantii DSM 8605]
MKKIIALVMSLTLMTSLVACGGGNSNTKNSNENAATPEVTEEADPTESTILGNANADKTLVVWTFTDEVKGMISDYYLKDNPDLPYNIEVVVVPTENYQTKLDPVLASGKNAPDVFTMEAAFVKKYIDSPFTMDLSKVGLEAKAGDTLPYVLDVAKDKDGVLKGLSWQGTPGAFFYRRSIAKEYLGVSEPDEVQALMNDFDGFIDVARTLDEKSGGKVHAISGTGDLTQVFYAAREHAWVENDTLVIDDKIKELFETAKILKDENLTTDAEQWSEAWFAGMSGDDVFGYLLPTWGLHYVLKTNAENATSGTSTSGDWGMVQGPSPYFWGGTWVGLREGTEMQEAAAQLVEYLTLNDDFLTAWAKNTGDFLSDQVVVDKIKGDFSEEFLAGQNHYDYFAEMAPKIDASKLQGSDYDIQALLGEQLIAYSNGEKDFDTAMEDFKAEVQNAFPTINVE